MTPDKTQLVGLLQRIDVVEANWALEALAVAGEELTLEQCEYVSHCFCKINDHAAIPETLLEETELMEAALIEQVSVLRSEALRVSNTELVRRLEQWRVERADWLYKEVPLTLIGLVFVCNGMTYLVSLFDASTKSTWWIFGSLLGLILAIPPLVRSRPIMPTMQDVKSDENLRSFYDSYIKQTFNDKL